MENDRDARLPASIRALGPDATREAHVLAGRLNVDLANETDAANLTDVIRMRHVADAVDDQRRAQLTIWSIDKQGGTPAQRAELVEQMRNTGLLPDAPASAPLTDGDVPVLPDAILQTVVVTGESRKLDTALGNRKIDKLAVGAG